MVVFLECGHHLLEAHVRGTPVADVEDGYAGLAAPGDLGDELLLGGAQGEVASRPRADVLDALVQPYGREAPGPRRGVDFAVHYLKVGDAAEQDVAAGCDDALV